MILNQIRALDIVSNVAAQRQVPALALIFEAFQAGRRKTAAERSGKACNGCGRTDATDKLKEAAFNSVLSLPAEDWQKLKSFLKEKDVYAYISVPGGQPQVRKLA
jgi:hypothetical protein